MHVPCSYAGCSSVSCTLLPAEDPCHLLLGISGASPQQHTQCSRMLHTHQECSPCSRLPLSWRIFVLSVIYPEAAWCFPAQRLDRSVCRRG